MSKTDDYAAFLYQKSAVTAASGLDFIPDLSPTLFPFQAAVARFSLRRGRAGIFLGTGLGKTLIQLEYCRHAAGATNGRALILTPLAVARQFADDGKRHGYDVRVIRDRSEVSDGINICNYDRLDKLDPGAFGAVCLDEGSILKSFGGSTQRAITAAFSGHRFRISATATPAPNDHMELGTQCEFLGHMSTREMLSRWFINDTSTASQKWRLKGHAVTDFWGWVATWARMATLPSDLGFSDDGYVLPPLKIIRHRTKTAPIKPRDGDLFASCASATSMFDVKRQTSGARADAAAAIVAREPGEQWMIWCDTNDEADALKARISGAIEVRGSQRTEVKEDLIAAFISGEARTLISKPSVCGWGLNFQHCARTIFAGRTFSFEAWHQSVRRMHRFGQPRPVHVHIIITDGESQTDAALARKESDHERMRSEMSAAMRRCTETGAGRMIEYQHSKVGALPTWISGSSTRKYQINGLPFTETASQSCGSSLTTASTT